MDYDLKIAKSIPSSGTPFLLLSRPWQQLTMEYGTPTETRQVQKS